MRKKHRRLVREYVLGAILAMVISLIGTVSADTGKQVNLLKNPGFEGEYKDGIAPGWMDNSSWADVKVNYFQEKESAYKGSAQGIKATNFNSGAVQFVQGGVPIEQGAAYEVSVWLRGKLRLPIEIMLRERGAPYTIYFQTTVNITDEWKEYKFVGVAPVTDKDSFFMIRFLGEGELWIDEASLSLAGSRPQSKLQSKSVKYQGDNYLVNGSFELGWERWAVQFRETGGYEYSPLISYLNPRPKIDTKTAVHGRSSLRLEIPAHGQVRLTSPDHRVNTGKEYILSLYLKSEPSGLRVEYGLQSGYLGRGKKFDKTAVVTDNWKRFEIKEQLPVTFKNAYYVYLHATGPAVLWVDAVELIETEKGSDKYSYASPVEIGLKAVSPVNLYKESEPVRIILNLFNYTANKKEVIVRLNAIDFWGKSQSLGNRKIAIGGMEKVSREIVLPAGFKKRGYFTIQGKVVLDGETVDISEMGIGILPDDMPLPSEGSAVGSHFSFNRASLARAKALGISWLRMHPPLATRWSVVEPKRGKFNYFDKGIRLAKSYGFNILGLLYSTPRWASSAPPEMVTQEYSGYRSYPAKNIADWENYVYRTVKHYKKEIRYWEIWNEPYNSFFHSPGGPKDKARDYTRLLKAAYKAAKKANPDSIIVGGVSGPGESWLKQIFAEGAYNYLDIVSYHRYFPGGISAEDAFPPAEKHIKEIKNLMKKYGKIKPIWNTEGNVLELQRSSYTNILQVGQGIVSPKAMADFNVRNLVALLGSGVDKWFQYEGFIPRRTDRYAYDTLFEYDGAPTSAAISYAMASWMLHDTKFKNRIELGTDVYGFQFSKGNGVLTVVWQLYDGPKTIKFKVKDAANTTVYDIMGNPIPVSNHGDTIELRITRNPVYIYERFK